MKLDFVVSRSEQRALSPCRSCELLGWVRITETTLVQVWGLRRLPSALFLCTKPSGSKKDSKKNEGEIITNTKADATAKLADEELRKFLARKTLITFPQRVTLSSLEEQPVSSSKRGLTKTLAEDDSSTSSSSDSDSSSDSEEEDDSFKESVKTKVAFPRRDHIFTEDQTTKINIMSRNDVVQEQDKGKKSEKLPYIAQIRPTSIKQKLLHETSADDKLLKPDSIKHATDLKLKERHLQSSEFGTKIVKSEQHREVSHTQVEAASSTLSKTQTVSQQNVVQNLTLLKMEEDMAKEVQKTEELQEQVLNGRMPMVDPTGKEEMVVEAGVQAEQSTIQETKPPVDTVQETNDISTYKNLQHHEYTPYTFVDYDVLLSKMRLPQPSSGRLSPRH
ncbi:hypothetical protein JRQ81_020119 [Phrynocephalus forsythii]|uniref:NADH dehydrogenase [ubiquinone] flavoprotein 3, mitochondrial n=1 Tax=Phrynocephalus forsythii TaxID=171643 RepID=A0A9Q0XNW9_9SAUR|nr:hypothetical protein JRQ81_020119 [Phrynocephalus forsythii]